MVYILITVSVTHNEDGKEKKVTEKYLVDAITYGEAETKIANELNGYDYSIRSMRQVFYDEVHKIANVIDDLCFFNIKIALVSYDEKSQSDKKNIISVLVEEANPDNALKSIRQKFSSSISDYDIKSINKSGIIAVI